MAKRYKTQAPGQGYAVEGRTEALNVATVAHGAAPPRVHSVRKVLCSCYRARSLHVDGAAGVHSVVLRMRARSNEMRYCLLQMWLLGATKGSFSDVLGCIETAIRSAL